MRVEVRIVEADVGAHGLQRGVRATYSRCGAYTESYGTGEGSRKRCAVLLKQQCLRGESNFYAIADGDGDEWPMPPARDAVGDEARLPPSGVKIMSEDRMSLDQIKAMLRVEDLFDGGEMVVALTGHAGAGKVDRSPSPARTAGGGHYGATTNKAAHVLRKKGVQNAATVHSLCVRGTIYTPKVSELIDWTRDPDSGEYPGGKRDDPCEMLEKQARIIAGKRKNVDDDGLLDALKVSANGRVESYIGRDHVGGLIAIDEASMLNRQLLDCVLNVYDKALLIGDPFKLPPIDGKSALEDVIENGASAHLTKIHRQGCDAEALACASWIRADMDGLSRKQLIPLLNGMNRSEEDGGVIELDVLPFDGAGPALVYTNKSRKEITRLMRDMAGLPFDGLVEGDTVVVRSNDRDHIAMGCYNNAELIYRGNHDFEAIDSTAIFISSFKLEDGRTFRHQKHERGSPPVELRSVAPSRVTWRKAANGTMCRYIGRASRIYSATRGKTRTSGGDGFTRRRPGPSAASDCSSCRMSGKSG